MKWLKQQDLDSGISFMTTISGSIPLLLWSGSGYEDKFLIRQEARALSLALSLSLSLSLSPAHWGARLFASLDRRALTPRRWIFLLSSK